MLTPVKSVVFCIFIIIGFNLASSASQQISECAAKGGECDESRSRPVCGSDGQTYASRCHLIRAQCNGYKVTLKHRGTCRDACLSSRSYALSQRPKIKFVPKCREDGTYAPIQCLENNGCWCVNAQGKPIQKTHTQHGRPNCTGKANQKRSSPGAPRKRCSPQDRVSFNTGLMNIFNAENSKSRAGISMGDPQIIEWKFKQLDVNGNDVLEKSEYQGLKKIAKTVVKPKRCGRRFGKYCDKNKDLTISRDEFHQCLGKDLQKHLPARGNANGLHVDDLDDEEDENEEESDEFVSMSNVGKGSRLGGQQQIRTTDDSHIQSVLWLRGSGKTTLNLHNEGNSRDPDDEINDCLKDRKNALEDKSDTLFLPACTGDGRYEQVQCYRSTGYCWCVNEDTGKPIPGTSMKDKRPQCDSHTPDRSMPGCPQKNEFLKDLKDFLKTQITSGANVGRADNTKWGTEDEKIATLSFVLLDKNKNKVWERREWRTFRELVTATKKLRRCGKKMPRFCDVNNDKKITLSEWLNCLQTQRNQNDQKTNNLQNNERPLPTSQSKAKLNGKNPLEFILKAD